jgi:integrase
MARPPTGQVVENPGKRDTALALRFRAYGQRRYLTLGYASEGWTRRRAEQELENVMADVRRGIWQPIEPAPVAEEPREEPTFHQFASEWYAARESEGLATKTLVDLKWSLSNHLLPVFAGFRLSEITPQAIDAYKVAKARERTEIEAARPEALKRGERFSERGLSNGSINHTLRHLSQILETAVEYGLIPSNPATGKRRRLKTTRPSRPWVEPEALVAFLDAAKVEGRAGVGRVLLGLLAGAGLRIGEALSLRWQHVDLGAGSLFVTDAKTAKGIREVHLTAALREELTIWKADTRHTAPSDFVIHTSTGRKHNPSNLRRDVLAPTVERANVKLEALGISPIGHLTFHGLRRTYASLRCVCGDDIRYTADQLGHEDPRFTLRCYAQASKRRDRLAKPQRDAFDGALEWAAMGSSDDLTVAALQMEATKNPV